MPRKKKVETPAVELTQIEKDYIKFSSKNYSSMPDDGFIDALAAKMFKPSSAVRECLESIQKEKTASAELSAEDMAFVDFVAGRDQLRTDWQAIADKLGKPVELIQRYANKQSTIPLVEEKRPTRPVTGAQQQIRSMFTPAPKDGSRNTATIMSEGLSSLIAEQQKNVVIKAKDDKNIFRPK